MEILISGAGIAGPTLAYFLAKSAPHAHITVVERNPSLLSYGQNIDISGAAITIVKKMGIIGEIRKLNTTEKGTQFIDRKGRPYAILPVQEGQSASLTQEFEILRGDLAMILYEATKSLPNVDYLFDTTIKEVVSNNDSEVTVQLGNGEMRKYSLLVAADGQWSKIRKQCFPPEDITVIDKGLYVAYWTIPRLPSDNNLWNVYHAPGSRVISIRPDPHNTIRAFVDHMPCNDAQAKTWSEASKSDRQTQEDLLRREFADAGWQAQRILDALDQAPDFYFQAIQQIRMSRWSKSRVVCLGDAAYAPTPLTGMGTSLAIIGAYILAGELGNLEEGEHPSKALEAYESTFRPFVEKIQNLPFFVPAILHPATESKIWMLQTFVRIVAKVVRVFMSIPWLVNTFGGESRGNFALPKYTSLDGDTTVSP